MKNKLFTILTLILIILSIATPFSNANDVTTNINDLDSAPLTTNTSTDLTIKEDDLTLFGDTVTIDYPVNGNIFIFANNVTITSQINGNVFIRAYDITIANTSIISGSLFTHSTNLFLNGVTYDSYNFANNIEINGFINRDLRANALTIHINGTIGRNAYLDSDNIFFSELTNDIPHIAENLNYYSTYDLTIDQKNIGGAISKYIPSSLISITFVDMFIIIMLTFTIIGGLILFFAPRFTNDIATKENKTTNHILYLVYGVISFIVLLIAALFFMTVSIGMTIFILISLVLLTFIGLPIPLILLTYKFMPKLKFKHFIFKFSLYITLFLVLTLLQLIPYIGSLLLILFTLYGVGIIIHYVITTSKKLRTDLKEFNATQKK